MKENRRESQKVSNYFRFFTANFAFLINITKEKPEQLTAPKTKVCHKYRKRLVMTPELWSPHGVFSPRRRSASLTFIWWQLRETAEKGGWNNSRKDGNESEVRWVVTGMISKGKKKTWKLATQMRSDRKKLFGTVNELSGKRSGTCTGMKSLNYGIMPPELLA